MDKTKQAGKPQKAGGSHQVLVIHGRDERNLARLKDILLHFHLDVILLDDNPSQGRTIIEKFEQLAAMAGFAIALMTPDDVVHFRRRKYRQARPNVHLELGWAFRHLGRSRVCILAMKGTILPSNLHGINRIDFEKSVNEVVHQLVSELESAGIIRYAARAS